MKKKTKTKTKTKKSNKKQVKSIETNDKHLLPGKFVELWKKFLIENPEQLTPSSQFEATSTSSDSTHEESSNNDNVGNNITSINNHNNHDNNTIKNNDSSSSSIAIDYEFQKEILNKFNAQNIIIESLTSQLNTVSNQLQILLQLNTNTPTLSAASGLSNSVVLPDSMNIFSHPLGSNSSSSNNNNHNTGGNSSNYYDNHIHIPPPLSAHQPTSLPSTTCFNLQGTNTVTPNNPSISSLNNDLLGRTFIPSRNF